jgi:hypothetical protein
VWGVWTKAWQEAQIAKSKMNSVRIKGVFGSMDEEG